MTEKQTPPSFQPELPNELQPGDVISDANLAMINEGAASGAAQRIIEGSTPQYKPQPETSTPKASRSEASTPRPSSYTRAQRAGTAIVAGAAIIGGVVGIKVVENATKPPAPTVDTSIGSITIHEGAIVRQDPSVGDSYEGAPNEVALFGQEQTVTDVYAKDGTNNGTWYGYEANQLPLTSQVHDDDGIVWINEENVTINKSDPNQISLIENDIPFYDPTAEVSQENSDKQLLNYDTYKPAWNINNLLKFSGDKLCDIFVR